MIGVNDDKVMCFRNRGTPNGKLVGVRLKGKSGNPTGVGARITLHLSDGSSRTREVYAGAGYLSQSPPDLSFGLGSDGKVTRIDVGWPGGKVSSLKSPGGEQGWVIAQPDQ